mgnify:CR=1 FL=1
MFDECPSELIYNAEILNIRPNEILNGFYPQFNQENTYTDYDDEYQEQLIKEYSVKDLNCKQDNDSVKDKPLILSIDWGLFLSAVVSQDLKQEFRCLNEFYKQQPDIIDDLIEDFCDYCNFVFDNWKIEWIVKINTCSCIGRNNVVAFWYDC